MMSLWCSPLGNFYRFFITLVNAGGGVLVSRNMKGNGPPRNVPSDHRSAPAVARAGHPAFLALPSYVSSRRASAVT